MAREYVLQRFHRDVDLRIDYAAELNPQQFAAVTAPPGPALVLAGAGSGKTRTLIYRVAYLMENGIPADRVLLLTFTNKAAREMMRRVADLLGSELSLLWGGTFHSIGARILRSNAERLGYRPDFTILDREDASALLKTCVGAAELDPMTSLPKPDVLADLLSRAANERRPLDDLLRRQHRSLEPVHEAIGRVATLYERRKRAGNVMDFDDLLALWLRLFEEHPEVRERYQQRFQCVLVDEYQDTNQIQSDLIERLGGVHGHVMVVGDDSQSIYSWRGANYRNILQFPQRYPGAQVYKIEINYRSTPEILAVANAALVANSQPYAKVLTAARRSGARPSLVPCEDTQQQAAFVAQRVVELNEEGVALAAIAVLYRSHFHALELQLEFTRRNIPFAITSGIQFFEQAHIKDVAAWLKMIANPTDELAFKRVVLLLPGIGPRAAEKLWSSYSGAYGAAALSAATGIPVKVAPLLMSLSAAVPKKASVAWAQVSTTLSQIEEPSVRDRPGEMIRHVLNGFYQDYAQDAFPNVYARLDDLEQLAAYATQFLSVTEFLTQLSLLNSLEAEAEQRSSANEDRVRLSTVHQAKGLEFEVVFVIMMADGMFPSARSMEDPAAIEEERRLFHVAVTRARDELYLSHPLLRVSPGTGMALLKRSRFLNELPVELLEEVRLRTSYLHPEALHGASDPGVEGTGESPF